MKKKIVIPAKAGIQCIFVFQVAKTVWIPAFARMTVKVSKRLPLIWSVGMTMISVRIMFVTVADNAMCVMVLVQTPTSPFKIVRMLMVFIVNMAV